MDNPLLRSQGRSTPRIRRTCWAQIYLYSPSLFPFWKQSISSYLLASTSHYPLHQTTRTIFAHSLWRSKTSSFCSLPRQLGVFCLLPSLLQVGDHPEFFQRHPLKQVSTDVFSTASTLETKAIEKKGVAEVWANWNHPGKAKTAESEDAVEKRGVAEVWANWWALHSLLLYLISFWTLGIILVNRKPRSRQRKPRREVWLKSGRTGTILVKRRPRNQKTLWRREV